MYRSRTLAYTFTLLFAVFVFDAAAQATGKRPVIIIPGVAGSQLVNAKTGKTVWFSVKQDKEDDLRLPMTSPVWARNRDGLRASDIIREVKLPVLPDVEVYKSLIDALKARGYAEADWKSPKATDVFYVFPYDWRRDNVETAHLLMRKMAGAKALLKRPDLKFDIVAHSMGGLIARYAAMYGLADLPREGAVPVPSWAGGAHINKLMMFGTPNEGAFSAFEVLIKGYPIIAGRNLPIVDDLSPGEVMTGPSVFQLLPHQSGARFLDENLEPLKIDFYDPATWAKYGWGAINDPKFLSTLKDAPRLALTNKEIKPAELKKDAGMDDRLIGQTTSTQVRAYFAAALNRAKRFHLALDAPSKTTPVELYAYGGNCDQTLDAVVIIRDEKKGKWETFFDAHGIKTSGGREFKKEEVKAAMFADGDGRVTKRSLMAETVLPNNAGPDINTILTLKSSFLACGSHTTLFLEKPIQDSFLSALVVEKQIQP